MSAIQICKVERTWKNIFQTVHTEAVKILVMVWSLISLHKKWKIVSIVIHKPRRTSLFDVNT